MRLIAGPSLCGMLLSGLLFVPCLPATSASADDTPAVAEVPASADTGKSYRLRYRFKTNDVVHYEVVHSMEITTRKEETSETATNESKADKHYRVISVDKDGNAILELTIDRVRMTAQFSQNDPVVFDSGKPAETPPQFEHVKRSVGKPLARIKVAGNGDMISIVDLLPASQEAQTGESDASRNFLIVFPHTPVRVGESWKDEPNLTVRVSVGKTLSRNVEILRRYELVSVEGNLATIRVKNSIITPVRDPSMRAQLIQRAPEGTIVFDMERGLLASRKLTTDNTEIGVFGDNSSMRAVSGRVEKLVPREEIAKKPR